MTKKRFEKTVSIKDMFYTLVTGEGLLTKKPEYACVYREVKDIV